ncbi:hypothetical protein ACFU98_43070 [Streptomyces sp. NPDC057575]|uniref:hypothetical protein n=1 Tax=unclassified Streptomyces TaxID=2593676 RepID=UPI003688650A
MPVGHPRSAAPGAVRGGGGFGDAVLEVTAPAAEGLRDAVGDRCGPAVADGRQDADAGAAYDGGLDAGGGAAFDERLQGDVDVADRAPDGFADEVGGLAEADRPRAGELVDLAAVAVVGQRQHGDLGDVLGVDERCVPVAGGQGQSSVQASGQPEALGEVLREPGRPRDRPVGAGAAHGLLGDLEGVAVVGLADACGRQQASRRTLRRPMIVYLLRRQRPLRRLLSAHRQLRRHAGRGPRLRLPAPPRRP